MMHFQVPIFVQQQFFEQQPFNQHISTIKVNKKHRIPISSKYSIRVSHQHVKYHWIITKLCWYSWNLDDPVAIIKKFCSLFWLGEFIIPSDHATSCMHVEWIITTTMLGQLEFGRSLCIKESRSFLLCSSTGILWKYTDKRIIEQKRMAIGK